VHFYTLSGCYLHEPAGSTPTFHTPEDNKGPTDGFMVVYGANVNFDADGNFLGTMDAGWIEQAVVQAAKAQGIGMPRYIKPKSGAGYSDEE
jgi:2,4'-dihydroxyacetophenone dioxygenase